jgi:glutamate receptor, ionotropic, plant
VSQEFDAAVADITITANRSQHVDFTLPYMSSGISMVVPVRDQRSKRAAWVFLKPLRYDLWLISFAFFVFTGFVVWAIEHRSNEEFRGPPSYQIGTLLYFGFSTLVFAHSNYSLSLSLSASSDSSSFACIIIEPGIECPVEWSTQGRT